MLFQVLMSDGTARLSAQMEIDFVYKTCVARHIQHMRRAEEQGSAGCVVAKRRHQLTQVMLEHGQIAGGRATAL